jgi:hypothetical protein
MDAKTTSRKSRIAALGVVIELIAIYRLTKIFRELRARRNQGGEAETASRRGGKRPSA